MLANVAGDTIVGQSHVKAKSEDALTFRRAHEQEEEEEEEEEEERKCGDEDREANDGNEEGEDDKDDESAATGSADTQFDVDAFEQEALPVVKEGYLYKRKQKGLRLGAIFHWQYRYCVVDNVARQVKYSSHESSKEHRVIPFCDIRRAFLANAQGEELGRMSKCLEFCLEMLPNAGSGNGSRIFVFRAQDPLDAAAWVRALRSVTVHGKEWEARGRRLSALVEKKVERLHLLPRSSPAPRWPSHAGSAEGQGGGQRGGEEGGGEGGQWAVEQGRGGADAWAKACEEARPSAAFEAMEVDRDVHAESKTKLRGLTKRIVARAKLHKQRLRRKQQERGAKQRHVLGFFTGPGTRRAQDDGERDQRPLSRKFALQMACAPCLRMSCLSRPPEAEAEADDDDDNSPPGDEV